jgi:hypothetical protein
MQITDKEKRLLNINERVAQLEQGYSELKASVRMLARMEHYVTPSELARYCIVPRTISTSRSDPVQYKQLRLVQRFESRCPNLKPTKPLTRIQIERNLRTKNTSKDFQSKR